MLKTQPSLCLISLLPLPASPLPPASNPVSSGHAVPVLAFHGIPGDMSCTNSDPHTVFPANLLPSL